MSGRGNPSSGRQVSDLTPPMTANESAPDPAAGERSCPQHPHWSGMSYDCAFCRATSSADDASEPRPSEADVEARRRAVLADLGVCEFRELVTDASMCRCGLPAVNHDTLAEQIVMGDHPRVSDLLNAYVDLAARDADDVSEREHADGCATEHTWSEDDCTCRDPLTEAEREAIRGPHHDGPRAYVYEVIERIVAAREAAAATKARADELRAAAHDVIVGAPVGNERYSARQVADYLRTRARLIERTRA